MNLPLGVPNFKLILSFSSKTSIDEKLQHRVIPWAFEVILLALVNDVTMLPVASDNASPSALPEIPSMPQILLAAFLQLGYLDGRIDFEEFQDRKATQALCRFTGTIEQS